jgi:3,4-dihydroxy-2-butanone 4-phosphate synthase
VLNQVEKIMAVAPSVSTRELAEGVARPHRMKGLRLPGHVLARLCEDTGLYERNGEQVLAKRGHPHWKDSLGKDEATLVEVLFDHGTVMRRDDLERIAHERGLKRSSFYLYLGSSPVLARYAPGVYGLRGTQVTAA